MIKFKTMNTETRKPFIVANVRDILDQYDREEMSFSRMTEMFNEVAFKWADEARRDAAEGFGNFLIGDHNPFILLENGRYCQACGNSTTWSMEELYSLYLNSINKAP